jgi:hypothetical protein
MITAKKKAIDRGSSLLAHSAVVTTASFFWRWGCRF